MQNQRQPQLLMSRPIGLLSVAFLVTTLSASVFGFAPGDDDGADSSAEPEAEAGEELSPYRLQISDDVVEPLQPVKPRDASKEKKLEAVARFMHGRVLERRQKFREAYAEYEKAIELDPDAAVVYKSIVPLAFQLRKTEDAEKYALKAVKLDPNDFDLLRRLGVFLATQSRIPDAINFLQQAVDSPELPKLDPARVILSRDLVILYGATGQMEKAAKHYETIFDALQNPRRYKLNFQARSRLLADELTNYEKIGQVFLSTKRFDLAIDAFKLAAADRRGSKGELNYYLAVIYNEKGQTDDALAELESYFDAKLDSKGDLPYEMLKTLLEKKKQEDQLIGRLEKLRANDSENVALGTYLAEQYVSANRLDDAEAIYRDSLEREETAATWLGLARIIRLRGEPANYLETISKAVPKDLSVTELDDEVDAAAEDEEFAKSVVTTAYEKVRTLELQPIFVAGLIASRSEQDDAAGTLLERSVELARRAQLGPAYDQLGLHYLLNDAYLKAAAIYEKASQDPALSQQRLEYLYRLSQAYEYGGETQKALIAIRKAKATSNVPLLAYQEGWIYYHARQWDNAIRIFEEVIRRHGDSAPDIKRRAQYSLSNSWVEKGDIDKGVAVLEEAYQEAPDDPGVNNDLGYLLADEGRELDRAEKMIRKAVKAEPDNGAYLDSLAWVLFRKKKYAEALKAQEQAMETIAADDATLQDHYGDILFANDRKEDAIKAWKAALKYGRKESFPDQEQLKKIEAKLKEHGADPNDIDESGTAEGKDDEAVDDPATSPEVE